MLLIGVLITVDIISNCFFSPRKHILLIDSYQYFYAYSIVEKIEYIFGYIEILCACTIESRPIKNNEYN